MTTKDFLDQISEKKSGKIRDFVEKGKQMEHRRILYLLVDMYMGYCGVSKGYRTVVYDLGWAVFHKYAESEETEFTGDETYSSVMPRLHPEYTKEYDEYDIAIIDDEKIPSFCMDILGEHDGDHEKCAAICYGMNCWLKLSAERIF